MKDSLIIERMTRGGCIEFRHQTGGYVLLWRGSETRIDESQAKGILQYCKGKYVVREIQGAASTQFRLFTTESGHG